jgi:hypothetical protein
MSVKILFIVRYNTKIRSEEKNKNNNPTAGMKTIVKSSENRIFLFKPRTDFISYDILMNVYSFTDPRVMYIVRVDASFRNVLSANILRLQEKGRLTALKNKWWKEKRGGGACQVSISSPRIISCKPRNVEFFT